MRTIKLALLPKNNMTQKERNAKHYRNRKDNGLCPRCGKMLYREGHYCSECLEKNNEYHKQNRIFYKQHHICTNCGKEIVFGNDKTCPECRAKRYIGRKSLTDEQKNLYGERFKKQQKALYQKRKEQGICTRCGKRKVISGKAKCGVCLEKDAKLHRKIGISRSERPHYGLCYNCVLPLDRIGGLCNKCAEARSKNLPTDRNNKIGEMITN